MSGLVLVLFLLECYCQCNMINKTSVIIFVSGKFSEMDAGTDKGQFDLDYGHEVMMEVGVYFKQVIQSNILL